MTGYELKIGDKTFPVTSVSLPQLPSRLWRFGQKPPKIVDLTVNLSGLVDAESHKRHLQKWRNYYFPYTMFNDGTDHDHER